RRKALAYHGARCAVCKTTRRLQVHHLTYERLGHERMSDFKILCKRHHPRGMLSAAAIDSWHTSYLWLQVISWVVFLPFRLTWTLVRYLWACFLSAPRSVN